MRRMLFSVVFVLVSMLVISSCSLTENDPVLDSEDIVSSDNQQMDTKAWDDRPLFQMPVPGGESWSVSTWSGHNPDRAADMNWGSYAESDYGKRIEASFSGKVTVSKYSTTSGYGNYVVIDHGAGWKTLYAHLKSRNVSVGEIVHSGHKIGECGHSSALYTFATHLHYEQQYNGSPTSIKFNGTTLTYYEKKNYTSKNYSKATGTVNTSGGTLNVRSGPGTSYPIVGTKNNGETINIYSQAYGQTVSGPYGTSAVWDHIHDGYVSDAYIYTGSDGLVAPVENNFF